MIRTAGCLTIDHLKEALLNKYSVKFNGIAFGDIELCLNDGTLLKDDEKLEELMCQTVSRNSKPTPYIIKLPTEYIHC